MRSLRAALGLAALAAISCAAHPARTALPGPPPADEASALPGRPGARGSASPPAPQAPAPLGSATPDRSQPPWSQTPAALLGVGEVERTERDGGTAWRIGTPRGVVGVWRPAGYAPRNAGAVIYLHGYFTTVDQAIADHRLFEQFRESGRDALFIVPESPAWNGEDPVWPALDPLLEEVAGATHLPRPRGPLVVAAHSGGFRPALDWLGDPRIEEVLLLDGLYRGVDRFRAWLDAAPRGARRRLVLVSDETLPNAEALAAAEPGAVSLGSVPPVDPGLSGDARAARLLLLRSQYPHMAIVEAGQVLPVLLRASHLAALR